MRSDLIVMHASVWSNISMCRGAAGGGRLLLRVHPKEPAVCHSS